jgi:ribose 5-phosphate isomerase A
MRMTQDEAKRLVAQRAVEFVSDGMVVGLGTGTTATLFIRDLAERKLNIRCVASSDASHELAVSLGMHVETLVELPEIDLYIDGADEVCIAEGAHAGLDLIKGGGGALLREKIVASASRRMVVIADSSKLVAELGRFPLPVEVAPFGVAATIRRIARAVAALGLAGPLTLRRRDGALFVTDGGHYILDCAFGAIPDPEALDQALADIPGVVDCGLFIGIAAAAIVAGPAGVETLGALD